jgi:hypothetical protein
MSVLKISMYAPIKKFTRYPLQFFYKFTVRFIRIFRLINIIKNVTF